jgi:exopolyphosphatase/guanosine-5'-triphosphate,3'-diphosphate pyrophosphatase
MKNFITIFLLFVFVALPSFGKKKECLIRRAAFDVGSGTTVMKVADVNVCTQTIIKILYEKQEKVDYKDDLIKNNYSFSNQIKAVGYEVFKRLKQEAQKWNVKQVDMAGVATASFRDAKNSIEFLNDIKNKTGIRIQTISQEEEGHLGFYAAISIVSAPKETIVVWDIGGGSMQITGLIDGKLVVHQGQLASVSFKNRVLAEVLNSKSDSPNPLSVVGAKRSVRLAQIHAEQNLNKMIQEKLKQVGGKVYGVGSVHNKSIQSQIKKEKYNNSDIENTLNAQSLKTDAEIGGKYASTDVTNLALVSGYMSAYSIQEVQNIDANNANGMLISPNYWEK